MSKVKKMSFLEKFLSSIIVLGIIGIITYVLIQQKQSQEEKKVSNPTDNKQAQTTPLLSKELQETMEKLADYEEKNTFVNYLIKTKEEEIKDSSLTSEEKTLLETLRDLRKEQQKILEERMALNYYYQTLTKEINQLDDQIKTAKTTEEKYRLKEQQGKKEQECLKIKETEKLIGEKEELNKVIENLTKQINETKSNETDKKNKLTTEKTSKETRKTTCQTQIDKYVKKYYLNMTLKQVEAEMKIPFITEEITTKLKEFKTMKENQLKTLESS
ncbi:hypothetical protein [Candidatus Phytoplasma sacchari]